MLPLLSAASSPLRGFCPFVLALSPFLPAESSLLGLLQAAGCAAGQRCGPASVRSLALGFLSLLYRLSSPPPFSLGNGDVYEQGKRSRMGQDTAGEREKELFQQWWAGLSVTFYS